MTDYSITVSNSVLFVGYNPTKTWGTITWGADNWRFDEEIINSAGKTANLGSAALTDSVSTALDRGYTITVSNNVLFVGYNPASAWGTMEWGTDSWRFNGDTVQDVIKSIDFGSMALADSPIKDVEHLTDLGSTLLSDSTKKAAERGISDQLDMSFEISSAFLTDANGYNYVFIGGVIDADDRSGATWTAQGGNSATWSPVAGASAVWS